LGIAILTRNANDRHYLLEEILLLRKNNDFIIPHQYLCYIKISLGVQSTHSNVKHKTHKIKYTKASANAAKIISQGL
jgi:hypothetical protein